MAKRHRQPDATAERTKQAIAKLNRYYELGRRAQKLSSSAEETYAKGVIAQVVDESGENKATVNKCRQFAEMYSPAEFKELCKLRRPDGKPIGWGHVTKLLTVPQVDRKLRTALQRRAANEGWTVRRLNDEIQGNYESESAGMGRKWSLPTSKQQALRQISQRSQQWLRWYEGLEKADEISVDDLPNDVQKQLRAAERVIKRLAAETTN